MPIPRIQRFAVECSCLSDEKNRHLTFAHLPFLSCQSSNRHVDELMVSIDPLNLSALYFSQG